MYTGDRVTQINITQRGGLFDISETLHSPMTESRYTEAPWYDSKKSQIAIIRVCHTLQQKNSQSFKMYRYTEALWYDSKKITGCDNKSLSYSSTKNSQSFKICRYTEAPWYDSKKSQIAIIRVCHTLQQKTPCLSRCTDTQKRHDTTVKKNTHRDNKNCQTNRDRKNSPALVGQRSFKAYSRKKKVKSQGILKESA